MQTQGLVRTDLQSVAIATQTKSESPLGIQSFQAYRFARTPFQLRLGVERVTPQVSAATQMLVRLSEHRQSMLLLRGLRAAKRRSALARHDARARVGARVRRG